MKLEPVALSAHMTDAQIYAGLFECDALERVGYSEEMLQAVRRLIDSAIPEGYVVVPVELIKEARRIIARAYADGNSASIRHYNCMTALDRLVDWKDGEECILPDEPR